MVHHVLDEHERLELVGQGNAAFIELLGRLFSAEGGRKPPRKSSSSASGKERLRRGSNSSAADAGKHRHEDAEERAYLSLFDRHTIRATLEEVADLYLDEDKKMVLDFSESRELVALQRPSARAPLEYTGMRWSLYRSPNRALAKDQDFCYLEIMKPFTSPSGRRGWAKCSHSVEHRICPDLSASPKIAVNRGRLHYCGVFFLETDEPGVLEGIFYYNVARANIPAALAPVVMKARGRNNARLLNHYAKLARITAQQQGPDGLSSSSKAAFAKHLQAERRCGSCSDRLPGWKARAKCVFCKAYMCKKCSAIVQRNYRVRDIGRNHVCFACAEQHGARLAQPSATVSVETASSDAGSNSFHFDDTDTATFDGDDAASSVATSTDDESGGVEATEHSHRLPQTPSGAAPRSLRRRSSSGSGASARSVPGVQHALLDPTAALTGKHSKPLDVRAHRTATVSGHAVSSKDRTPLPKTRSAPLLAHSPVPHLASVTGRPPPPPPPSPEPAYQRKALHPRPPSRDRIAAAVAGSADLGSPKGLNLDQVNLRHRSQTTSAVPSHSHGHGHGAAGSQRERAATTAVYSRDNPCDLSYLSGFK